MIIVEVTQEDIDLGVQSQCDACAFARAMRRVTGASLRPSVGAQLAFLGYQRPTYWLTPEAREFVAQFDRNPIFVEPTTFALADRL